MAYLALLLPKDPAHGPVLQLAQAEVRKAPRDPLLPETLPRAKGRWMCMGIPGMGHHSLQQVPPLPPSCLSGPHGVSGAEAGYQHTPLFLNLSQS